MMTIVHQMRRVGTRIVSILVSFREIHVQTQQHALLTTINLFVLALQDMKRMHMDNVLQVGIFRRNVIEFVCANSPLSTGVKPNSIYFFIVKKGECDHDTDCSDDKACIEHSCRDPCKLGDLCGQDAICETSAHRPVCRCPEGWGGVPTTQCFQCKKRI